MRTDLFDFALPADRIALRPVSPRDSARLLVVKLGTAGGEQPLTPLTPAEAGVQEAKRKDWMPAFAGMSGNEETQNKFGRRS